MNNTLTIEGSNLAYQDVGTGPVILFGHSYLWNSHMWVPQVEVLSKNFRCIVPDFWGHGASAFTPKSMASMEAYAEHMIILMNHLDIKNFSIVGLSVGGMWGCKLARLIPQQVNSLVMMDTFVGIEPQTTQSKYDQLLDAIEVAREVPDVLKSKIIPLFFSTKVNEYNPNLLKVLENQLDEIKGDLALEIVKIGRWIFHRENQLEAISQFNFPVMFCTGNEDIARPPSEAMLMHKLLPNSEFAIVPNAGHISNLENPEFVTHLLKQFLEQHH